MLSFILDGNIVTEPEGIREVTHRIYYNEGLNGYLEQFDGSIMFYGSEYTYLRNRFFVDTCSIIPIEVINGQDRYLGNLFLNDAEWEPQLKKVTCQIVDRSFLSLIDNNKDIKAYINVPRSKNDIDITAYTTVQADLVFKEHQVGVDTPTPPNRSGVRVYDAFKFLVAFMTDGIVQFESNYFNPETNPSVPSVPRNPTLITGFETNTGNGEQMPYISFEELYTDINRLYSISFSMEQVNGLPTMRIEPKSYYRNSQATLQIPSAVGIRQEAQRESFYQLIKFGDSTDPESYDFFPPATFLAWVKEEYHLGGQCNTKNTLDLQLKTLIINTNAIQGTLPYGSGQPQNVVNPPYTDYNDDIFLVIFDGNNETVVNTNPIDADFLYYNARLTNYEVSNNWSNAIPFSIYLFLGLANNYATGMLTLTNSFYGALPVETKVLGNTLFGPVPLISPLNLNDDTFPNGTDPNGLYSSSNATAHGSNPSWFTLPVLASRYTAPFNAVYTVHFSGIIKATITSTNQFGGYGVSFQVFSSTNVFKDEIYFPASFQPPAPGYGIGANIWDISATFFLLTGDYVIVTVFDPNNYTDNANPPQETELLIFRGATFRIEDPLGGDWNTFDPASNYLLMSECTYPIAADWWRQFRQNWHSRIQITYGGNDETRGQAYGYVEEITRPIYSGDAEVKIVSKFADVTR